MERAGQQRQAGKDALAATACRQDDGMAETGQTANRRRDRTRDAGFPVPPRRSLCARRRQAELLSRPRCPRLSHEDGSPVSKAWAQAATHRSSPWGGGGRDANHHFMRNQLRSRTFGTINFCRRWNFQTSTERESVDAEYGEHLQIVVSVRSA